MLNQPIEEKWKEEFNKKFCSKTSEPKYSVWNAAALAYPEEIKSFIENLLEQERNRMSEEIEKLKRYDIEEDDGACGDPECCGLASYMIEETGDGEYLGRDDVLSILKH